VHAVEIQKMVVERTKLEVRPACIQPSMACYAEHESPAFAFSYIV
jgi:hypothetical protein